MNKVTVRISGESYEFLKKFKNNRLKLDIDNLPISYPEAMDIIMKFFKNNNDQYLKIVKMRIGTNGS
jgi:hypothetical protein